MTHDVVCLRPEADFARVGALPPKSLTVAYRAPDDAQLTALLKGARAVVMPAVGPKLAPALFEGSRLALVQVTGAGVDRLDAQSMKRLGIPVANVPGGSNGAVAEYAVTAASMLLRRFAWADAEIRRGSYAAFRARLLADNLPALEAIRRAAILRFRPIMMTTMAAMLGGVPLMLGQGTGAEIRQPLGYAMVGGLLVSHALTLFTTPVVYLYLDKLSQWLGRGARSTSRMRPLAAD